MAKLKTNHRHHPKAFVLKPILPPSRIIALSLDDQSDAFDSEWLPELDPTLDPLSPEFEFPSEEEENFAADWYDAIKHRDPLHGDYDLKLRRSVGA